METIIKIYFLKKKKNQNLQIQKYGNNDFFYKNMYFYITILQICPYHIYVAVLDMISFIYQYCTYNLIVSKAHFSKYYIHILFSYDLHCILVICILFNLLKNQGIAE